MCEPIWTCWIQNKKLNSAKPYIRIESANTKITRKFEKLEGETPYLRLLGHNGDAIGASIEKLGGNQRTNVDGDLDALCGLHLLSSQTRKPSVTDPAEPQRKTQSAHHRKSRSNPGTESWEILKLRNVRDVRNLWRRGFKIWRRDREEREAYYEKEIIEKKVKLKIKKYISVSGGIPRLKSKFKTLCDRYARERSTWPLEIKRPISLIFAHFKPIWPIVKAFCLKVKARKTEGFNLTGSSELLWFRAWERILKG